MNKAWAFRFAIPMAMVGVCVVGAQQKPSELGFFITSVGSGKEGGLRRHRRRGQALPAARAGGRRGQSDLARLLERQRRQARQCQGPHRRGPLAERQGRCRGHERRRPA